MNVLKHFGIVVIGHIVDDGAKVIQLQPLTCQLAVQGLDRGRRVGLRNRHQLAILQTQLGKVTVLLGRNGVGKTTLLKSLMGLVPIKTGSIELDGQLMQNTTPYERARAGMGFVPQGRDIFARLTVEENLRMGLAYKSASTPIPAELYELFPVLKQMLHRRG